MERRIMDGNEACATISYNFTEVAGIYPITPSSTMAELTDLWASQNRLNFFDSPVRVVEMQSEAGAAGMIHGSLQAGCLTTTYTASQGLLLMIPNMYKIAGEQLPLVIHVAARSIATHALSIFGDHQDIYATRMTGFAILASSNPQEAGDMAAIAHLSTIKGRVPFLHFFDGFRTSHELNNVQLLDSEDLRKLIDEESLQNFRNNALTINNVTRGTAQNDDIYFQNTEVRNPYYQALPDVVESYMNEINKLTGRDYQLFNYYGSKNAKHVIVAMGSVTDTIKEVIDARKDEVGLIQVHLYRPFSVKHLLASIPESTLSVAVLDRTKEAGSSGEPLYKDVVEALKDKNIKIYGGRYGLSSKNTTPSMINGVFESLKNDTIHNNFTIGIKDDVTNLSLEEVPIKTKTRKEFLIWGYGSDGMVSASKDIMKITGSNSNSYVQGYFQYDSKKSGGLTKSHLRFDNEVINSPYYVENPSLVVCTKESYLKKFSVVDNICDNGILLLNTDREGKDVLELFTTDDLKLLKDRNISLYVIDALKIAKENNLDNKISSIMELGIFKFGNVLNLDIAKEEINKYIEKRFSRKGSDIALNNKNAVKQAENAFIKIDVEIINDLERITVSDNKLINALNVGLGDNIPVSSFVESSDGTYSGGLSNIEKRSISSFAPRFNSKNCIQCNMCSFVCPHAVIRPYLLTKEELDNAPSIIKEQAISANLKDEELYYVVCPSIPDCTGCKLCSNICPGKRGEKALFMEAQEELKKDGYVEAFDYLENNVTKKNPFNKNTVKGSQFERPKFTFPGACAGCGETSYLKLVSQLFGDSLVVANATGCSSIYSASLPTTAWSTPWANSLFEDNAEYGFGMKIADDVKKEQIKKILRKYRDILDKDIVDSYLEEVTLENSSKLYNLALESNIVELLELKEFIKKKTFFIIGGDGWAYDIGFSGIDHVLASHENVNILVLDTEVYSNTGGQSSKSTKVGAVAKFASNGKETAKKDLAKIALTYPHVYVGTVSMGANMQHTIKVLNEAVNYNGPSIIIAYAPCIAQGLLKGMENTMDEEKDAVTSGYFPLFHYNPTDDKFTLDSKADFTKYQDFLSLENRYKMLKAINEERYKKLAQDNEENAKKRYEYYQTLANQEKN